VICLMENSVQSWRFPAGLKRSLDQLGRPREHLRRNRQADLLGRFQIDHELKLGRLLDRQIGGLGSLQDSVQQRKEA